MANTNIEGAPIRRRQDSALRVRLRRGGELLGLILSNPTTVFGLILIFGMLGMALFAPWLTQANTPDPYQMPRD